MELYKEILEADPENIDAINSQAQCLKALAQHSPDASSLINEVLNLY